MLKSKRLFKQISLFIFFFCNVLIVKDLSAATFKFNKLYIGAGTTYVDQSQQITNIATVTGTGFQFYQDGAQFSGNNINGTLSYLDNNSNTVTIYGKMTRLDQINGNTHSFYVVKYTDATFSTLSGEAYLLIVPGKESQYSSGSNVSTSSNFSAADLNAVVNNMPTITTGGTLNEFTVTPCITTPAQSFTVTASSLTANISVNAPTGFAVSASQSGTYSTSLTLTQTGGVVNNANVWVKLTSTAIGTYSGTISLASTGAGTQIVSVSGTISGSVGTLSGTTIVASATNTNTLTLVGSTGTIQWQSSTNNITYTDVAGATSSTYTATNVAATTYYRAVVTNGTCVAYSNIATITFDNGCYAFGETDFKFNGNATLIASDEVRLTLDQGNQNGSIWNRNKVNLDYDFDISSSINLGNRESGADGIAFVLQNLAVNAGSAGGGLGYSGITPSFAVEFDTYFNGGADPGSGSDHISLVKNGQTNNITAHSEFAAPYEVEMEDGLWHDVRFVWTAATKNFKVYWNGSNTPLYNITVDLKANIFSNASNVFFGFTAATGGAMNVQKVKVNSYCLVKEIAITPKPGYLNAAAATSICDPATVKLEASPSTSYAWYKDGVLMPDSTSQSIIVSTAGVYKVAGVDARGIASTSPEVTVTVGATLLPGTITASNSVVCRGTNSTLLTLTGETGSIQWQSSTNGTTFSAITGATSNTYTVTNLTTSTYYKAVVSNGICSSDGGTISITVNPLSVAGTISGGNISYCTGSTNSTSLRLSGYTGTIQWQSSADNVTFTDIVGANSATYSATDVRSTTYYRAVVQSGLCTAANSSAVSISVTNCIEAYPDNNSTSVSVPVSGNVSTNDIITAGTTYGRPTPSTANPSGATITLDAATGTYTFTATAPGKYVYYISICGVNQTSNCPVTLLQITVLDPTVPNNAPVANADIATTNLNTPVTTSILANDKSGNIGTSLVPSSVTIVTQPKNGTVAVNTDGTLTYTPTTGFTGKDSLVYNVCDNATPANCQSTYVYYKVLSAGAASTTSALDDYAYVTNNKTGTASVSGTLLSNDKNTSGSALTASLVTGPTTNQGSLTLNANGTYTFVPTLGFSGPVDVVYNACTSSNPAICAKATLHIVVSPPPTINPDFNSTNINTPVPGNINTNDLIPAGTTYGTPLPSSNNPTGATITMNATTGNYTFTASKPGKYIFQVPVCAASQTSGCPLSPLQITVLDPNSTTNPPVANNDYSSTKLNTSVVTRILANDKPGNVNTELIPTSISINSAPKNGTGVANITTISSSSLIKSSSTVGTITYTPNNGFTGLDSLVYTVCDNASPANCEVATVYYTISTATPNNVLVANDDYNISINRVPALGNLLINDDYGNANLTSSLVTGPTALQGDFELSLDGTYKFTPAFGYTGPVDIIYQACSGSTCINATLHILVNITPPPPPTVVKATYVAGSRSNPSDIKSLVTETPAGTTLKWCDPTGTTCTTTPPTLPTAPGTYIWCVKSVDIVTLQSSICAMDTVVILAPYTVMEVTKTARSIKSNPDGSVLLTFVLKAANKTNAQMDSVSIKDDLGQTFKTTSGFSIAALDVYGGLVKNASYDGVSNVDLVTNQSKIAANAVDSVILKVLIASPNINGNLTNTAIMGGKTKYGYVTVNSNDPIANPSDTTKRTPTAFLVPKADLIIAGGFSPNNDGLNDKWIIIRPFGTTIKVKVFNRWGNVVYENEDYKNDWDGRGQKNFMGEFIPDGTYFYVVNAVDASGNIKNFASSMTVVR